VREPLHLRSLADLRLYQRLSDADNASFSIDNVLPESLRNVVMTISNVLGSIILVTIFEHYFIVVAVFVSLAYRYIQRYYQHVSSFAFSFLIESPFRLMAWCFSVLSPGASSSVLTLCSEGFCTHTSLKASLQTTPSHQFSL
jgi:hypothetical protein